MDTLKDALIEKTQDLKELFIEKSIEYAKREFYSLIDKLAWTYETWVENYPKRYTARFNQTTQVTLSKSGHRLRDLAYKAFRIGIEAWVNKAEKAAKDHYDNSILKLRNRLAAKGIGTNFDIKSSRLGVNFDMTIRDNDTGQTVRAWTIVASGPIQRPHYRYLVK